MAAEAAEELSIMASGPNERTGIDIEEQDAFLREVVLGYSQRRSVEEFEIDVCVIGLIVAYGGKASGKDQGFRATGQGSDASSNGAEKLRKMG